MATSAPPGPPPPFDPELAAALGVMAGTVQPSMTPDMIPLRRQERAALPSPTNEQLSRSGALEISERKASGSRGAPDVPLLIARPSGLPGALGAIYYAHAGGMVLGDRRSVSDDVLGWAVDLGLVVVSVEYRLAPEHPHPAPAEDCYAGLAWTAAHSGELGIDPGKVIVTGASAGGGLAAALALMARDRGGPALAGQMLICPMLDDRNDTPSSVQMAGLGNWDRTANETAWAALLGPACGGPAVSPYAAPARATDLSGLPPAFIDVGSAETFRDEDVAYALAIWRAGGRAELHVWPGGFHGYDLLVPQAAVSQATKAARLNWLRRLLNPGSTTS